MSGAYRDASATAPARRGAVVTFDDTNQIKNTRALYVGSAGNIAVLLVEDSVPVTLQNVSAGTILPVQAIKVLVTGTTVTAGTVIALY